MDWIPVIKPGLWNAWIPMLLYPLQPYILMLVDKAVGTGDVLQKMGSASADEKINKINQGYTALVLVMLAYSVLLPLKLGTAWFYAGLGIYLAGLVVLISAMVTAAGAPQGQLFMSGIYRYSRHPMYLAILAIYVGVGVACASWLFLLLAGGSIYLMTALVNAEERGCLQLFGDAYQEYMKTTPKWLGLPRSKSLERVSGKGPGW